MNASTPPVTISMANPQSPSQPMRCTRVALPELLRLPRASQGGGGGGDTYSEKSPPVLSTPKVHSKMINQGIRRRKVAIMIMDGEQQEETVIDNDERAATATLLHPLSGCELLEKREGVKFNVTTDVVYVRCAAELSVLTMGQDVDAKEEDKPVLVAPWWVETDAARSLFSSVVVYNPQTRATEVFIANVREKDTFGFIQSVELHWWSPARNEINVPSSRDSDSRQMKAWIKPCIWLLAQLLDQAPLCIKVLEKPLLSTEVTMSFPSNVEASIHVSHRQPVCRQLCRVRSPTHTATLHDWVLCGDRKTAGTSTTSNYRVYTHTTHPGTGQSIITAGQSVDVPTGMDPTVLWWRKLETRMQQTGETEAAVRARNILSDLTVQV